MTRKMYGLLIILVSFISAIQAGFEPCTDQSVNVIDEPRRKVGNKDTGTNLLCDRVLTSGWYRFHDAEIPFNQCIRQYDCGTHVPLWIKGQYPAATGEAVLLTACGDLDPADNDCCDYNISVAARNCGSHLVYYLQPTDGCSISYCADTPPRCTGPQYSQNGYPPCVDAYPIMTGPPKFSNPVLRTDDFEFQCSISYPHNISDGSFEVTWEADGRILSQWSQTLSGYQRVARLPGEALQGHLNSIVTCSVTSYFTNKHTGGLHSPVLTSNGYWVGVKYTDTMSYVDQKSPSTTLTLTSTIPIVCRQPGHSDCNLTLAITTDNGNIAPSTCIVTLKPTDWNPATHSAQTSYTVSLVPNIPITSGGHTHVITQQVLLPGKEWIGVMISNYMIGISSNKPGAQCRTVGDPHYKTFDNAKHVFTDFRVGRFTMVNQLHGGSFKVETQTWKPHNMKPSFNCGVAIREGNDVITLSMCDNPMTNPKLEIQNPSMYENHIEVVQDQSGNNYVFKGRSGAYVKVTHIRRRHINMLNIFINVPGTFMDDTEGLCGYFDGNMDNDYTRSNGHVDPNFGDKSDFIESWRIPTGKSLFEKAEPLPVLHQQSYCQCNGQSSTLQCGTSSPSVPSIQHVCKNCTNVTPQLSTNFPTTTTLPSPSTTSQPSPTTSLPSSTTTPAAHAFTVTTGPKPSSAPQFIPPVISKMEATKICFTMLYKYPSTVQCISNKNQVEFTNIVDMCVTDVELTGDEGMWVSALQTMMEGCAFRELVNTTISSNTVVLPPKTQSCPGACTGNGDCVNGSCVCAEGFGGNDCSFNSSALPTLDGTSGSVRNCDSRTGDCYSPVMSGTNFYPGATQCYMMNIQYNWQAKPTVVDTTPHSTPTDFQSSHYVTCHLKLDPQLGKEAALKGYEMSVSNNGGLSLSHQTDLYLIYDSKCLSCEEHNICTVKPDTCLIENKCYRQGEDVSHSGWCQPQISQYSSTGKPSSTRAPITTTPPVQSTSSATVNTNKYTASTTGCQCVTDVNSYDCACCANWGCPCPTNKHACFDCDSLDMCNV